MRVLAAILALQLSAGAACLKIEEARQNIGRTTCVAGRVVKVVQTQSGHWFLDFCDDYKTCPFTVVVFGSDLRDVGDVRRLEGKDIQVSGKIKLYGGRAEIVLRDARQLRGSAAKLPPVPKDYDVERHGNFRATAPRHSGTSRPAGDPSDVERPR